MSESPTWTFQWRTRCFRPTCWEFLQSSSKTSNFKIALCLRLDCWFGDFEWFGWNVSFLGFLTYIRSAGRHNVSRVETFLTIATFTKATDSLRSTIGGRTLSTRGDQWIECVGVLGMRTSLAHSLGCFSEVRNLNTRSSCTCRRIEVGYFLRHRSCLSFRKWRDRGQLETGLFFEGKVLSHGYPRMHTIQYFCMRIGTLWINLLVLAYSSGSWKSTFWTAVILALTLLQYEATRSLDPTSWLHIF